MTNVHPKPVRRSRKLQVRSLFGVGISIACLIFVFRKIDVQQVYAALQSFKWHFVLFGLGALTLDYAARIERWAVMLRIGRADLRASACAAPFLGSITLNNVLPFRAGDLVRALVFPTSMGIRRTTATASLMLERLIDLLTLLLALGAGLWLNPESNVPDWLGKSAVVLAVVGGLALASIMVLNAPVMRLLRWLEGRVAKKSARLATALGLAMALTRDIGQMARMRALLPLLGLSAVIWMGETGLFWAVLRGLSVDSSYSAALVIMAVSTLSTLVPSSPGYVGPFHLAAYSAALMLGGSPAQAASFAVLAHLGLWLPTTLAGSVAILLRPALFKGRDSRLPEV